MSATNHIKNIWSNTLYGNAAKASEISTRHRVISISDLQFPGIADSSSCRLITGETGDCSCRNATYTITGTTIHTIARPASRHRFVFRVSARLGNSPAMLARSCLQIFVCLITWHVVVHSTTTKCIQVCFVCLMISRGFLCAYPWSSEGNKRDPKLQLTNWGRLASVDRARAQNLPMRGLIWSRTPLDPIVPHVLAPATESISFAVVQMLFL